MSVVSSISVQRNNSTVSAGNGSVHSLSNPPSIFNAESTDEDPMKDFQLLSNNSSNLGEMVYGQVDKSAMRRSLTHSLNHKATKKEEFANNSRNEPSLSLRCNRSERSARSEPMASSTEDQYPEIPTSRSDYYNPNNSNNNNTNHDDPVDIDDDDESGVEVLPLDDMKRLRVQLQASFSGIPMPTDLHRSNSTQKRTKIDPSHPQYELAVGMMLGIREAVSGMEELSKEAEWTEEDFTTDQLHKECRRNRKYTFHTNSNTINQNNPTAATGAGAGTGDATTNTETSTKSNPIRFKAYAPLVFARLRNHLDKNLFLHSVCGNFRYLEFLSNAKSGSFFFFSHDGKYLIKTLTMTETHFFVNDVLPTYYHYLQHNPCSFISRFYGLYRIQLSGGANIYFSIMQSVFSDAPLSMNHTFDLKGSTLGRRAEPKDTVQKDLDILDQERKLRVPSQVKTELLQQLRRDVTFLARLGIMDYSFLLGICDEPTVQDLEITPAKVVQVTVEEQRDLEEEPRSPDSSSNPNNPMNSITASPYTQHEDEFIDWSELDWFRRSSCTDDCSVTSSLDFLTGGECSSESESSCDAMKSLLSVTHHCPALSQKLRHGCVMSSNGQELYYAGIIDILQPYNVKKWGETMLKQMQGNPHRSISCVDPETYANRFIQFLSNLLLDKEETTTASSSSILPSTSTGVLS